MSRPLRIEYPGAIYHITSRGNARQPIFEDDKDRELFLELLGSIVSRYKWLCHTYCLMDNHYHLLIETVNGNLSQGMRQLNGIYTQRFNRRHGRIGHVFQGRFKSILVDREGYLLELCRYVVLNPVRAGMVKSLEKYKWSSYQTTTGIVKSPVFLTTDWVLSQFGRVRKQTQEKYREFVRDGIGKKGPWEELKGQILLGDEEFIISHESYLKEAKQLREVPREQRFLDRPGLEELFRAVDGKSKKVRDRMIQESHLGYGYTLVEIGKAVGLHYTTISRIVNKK